jgi:hypothetical protein
MAIFTYADSRRYAQSITLSESVKIATASAALNTKDVFLSYSSKDHVHLLGVISFLEEHGASVYVDVGDKSLPEYPSRQTATILKGEILKKKRFIVVVSPNSHNSRCYFS